MSTIKITDINKFNNTIKPDKISLNDLLVTAADINTYTYIKSNEVKIDSVSVNTKAKLSGSFFITKENKTTTVYIKKVLYNNPVTVVWWSDDTITRNKCPENVSYNPDSGLMFCIAKKLFGNDNIAQIFHEWSLPENEEAKNNYVTLKDIRKNKKESEND